MRRAALALVALATGCASIAGLDLNGFHPRHGDAGTSGSGSGGDASASGGASGSGGSSGSGGNGGTSGTGGTSGSGGNGGSAGIDGGAGTGGSGGTTDSDAGFTLTAPSCGTTGKGLTDCGPTQENCCKSEKVLGGTFLRDGSSQDHATVSDFHLDKYEVTVGRFRQFVAACDSTAGCKPGGGDGRHAYLRSGAGLVAEGSPGTYEGGWDTNWNSKIPATKTDWDTTLACGSGQTWTKTPGTYERRPINCVTWYEAYAFCIWDGGFLPSDAEWNYAASAGGEQRVYPWSVPASSGNINCLYANYNSGTPCYSGEPNDVGSESPLGSGLWGNADLAGNVAEWTLDFNDPLPTSCTDCAGLDGATNSNRIYRGGAYSSSASDVRAAAFYFGSPGTRFATVGVRCARAP